MPRFASMLTDGMKERGHEVQVWSPKPYFFKLRFKHSLRKWLGYLDQYVVFPLNVRRLLAGVNTDNTLFVFTDQALGPWVPLVARYPHVIHCHDFLAQRSAQDEVPENKSSATGKQYQAYIRRGFQKGEYFISVSEKTRRELHSFLSTSPKRSEVIYNGLNQAFKPGNTGVARMELTRRLNIDLTGGYVLHVGGNQWYKNRLGVVEIYDAWRSASKFAIPLIMVGKKPPPALQERCKQLTSAKEIHWLSEMTDEEVKLAYVGASVFLFPSLAEGFGWPIAEAMASGCPVITTDEAPMTEVAGGAAFLVPRRPFTKDPACQWAKNAAQVLDQVVSLSGTERELVVSNGIRNAERFDPTTTLDRIEHLYQEILQSFKS